MIGSQSGNSTVSFADLYGSVIPGQSGKPQESQMNQASGKTAGSAGSPAISWVGMLIILVAIRVLYGFAK